MYLEIACIKDLVDVATSSDDAGKSKPAPDIFQVALKKLGIEGPEAVAIGDTPYDAEAAGKAGIPAIGLLCGGLPEPRFAKVAASQCIPGRVRCSPASTPPQWRPATSPHRRPDGISFGRFGGHSVWLDDLSRHSFCPAWRMVTRRRHRNQSDNLYQSVWCKTGLRLTRF